MKKKKINLVCDRRLNKYFSVTERALKEARKKINRGKQRDAGIVLDMAERYFSDASYFRKRGHYVNAFASLNYAHGWLDAGSKLGLFDVTDSNLFVVK